MNAKMAETADARAFRHKACREMGLNTRTRWITCAIHWQRGHVEDVYEMNNWEVSDDGIRCESSHPYCFAWCSRQDDEPAATLPAPGEET